MLYLPKYIAMSDEKWTSTFPSGIGIKEVERGDITKLGGPPPIRLIPAARKKDGNYDKAAFCSLKLSNNSKDSYPKFEGGSGEVTGADCQAQKDLCKVRATETTTKTFELYASDDASRAMMASIAKLALTNLPPSK